MDRYVIGKQIVGLWRRNNQLIRIFGNDKIKGVVIDVCGYFDVLVKFDVVKEFVKFVCIRIINYVDVEIKIIGN